MAHQLNSGKPCSSREHIESIEKPGHCVWCDAPLRCEICGVSKGHAASCELYSRECALCRGTGRRAQGECGSCRGKGRVQPNADGRAEDARQLDADVDCQSCGEVVSAARWPVHISEHWTGKRPVLSAAEALLRHPVSETSLVPADDTGELAAHRSTLLALLSAVADGATLVLGPAGEYAATAHGIVGFLNGPGARSFEAYALTLPEVLSDLARQMNDDRQLPGKVRD